MTVNATTAATLLDRHVLVNIGSRALSGRLTAFDATTFTVAHTDHTGASAGATTLPYSAVDGLSDFYADFDGDDDLDA